MANNQEVKLLGGWFSPFAHRVEMALKLKGIQYEVVEEDIRNKSPLLLKYNPISKKIPTLVHNGRAIFESLIIIEYIDENWKHNPILPEDTYEKARARFWAKFIEEKLTEVTRRILATDGELQDKEVKEAREALEVLEGELKDKKFFGGHTIGFADVVLGWTTIWLEVIEEIASVKIFDSVKYPSLAKWMQNLAELPIIKENARQHDMLIQYFRVLRQFLLASAAKNEIICP